MAKKYASIDFLRGFAIWMMVFVHTLMRWVDQDGIEATLDQLPMLILVILLAAIFFGGWAGFFLMVSATGNMISMHKNMKRNGKVGDVVLKQIIGGVLLLFCAVLTETLTGYHGYLGEIALGRPDRWDILLYRGFHMETIHAVAWCIILNGIVQGLLSIKGGYKKIKRNMIIYAILALIVILVSVPVWMGVDLAFPGISYPFGERGILYDIFGRTIDKTDGIQYGYIGFDSFWMLTKQFFLFPLAGGPEPVFPFLAVSFIGSIIGLFLMKKEEEKEENPDKLPSTRPLTIGLIIGFSVFIIGLVVTAILGVMSPHMDVVGVLISRHYDVRGLWHYGGEVGPIYAFVAFSWFIMGAAAQFCAILLLLRVVEFRGKAKQFGRKTRYFNRFGTVAFSIYNYQFVDIIMVWIFIGVGVIFPGLGIPGAEQAGNGYTAMIQAARNAYGPFLIWFLIAAVYGLHQILLLIWEKFHFTLGFEWFISKTANILVPSKRKTKVREGFFKTARLDPKKTIYAPDYIELVPFDKVQHNDLVDSKLAAKLSWVGLVIPPLALVSLGIAQTASKTEGRNKYSNRGYWVSIVGICLTIMIISVLFALPGIAL